MFLRIPSAPNMPLSQSLLPARKKWDMHIRKMDDAINRANAIVTGDDSELALHHIEAVEKTYSKYENAWDAFVNRLLEANESEDEYANANEQVIKKKWDIIGKLTAMRKHLRDEENKHKARKEVPTLKIPEFHGNHEEWSGFWESYNDVIHENPILPPTLKFHHLKGALKGEAAGLISGFEITDANYKAAIDLLKKKFDDPDKTKRVLIVKLLELKLNKHNKRELTMFQ